MKTLQNAFTISETEIKIGYLEEEEMHYIKAKKNSLDSFNAFQYFLNAESGLLVDSFVCQFTNEQTLSNQFSERVWVKQGEESHSIQSPSNAAYTAFKNESETLIQ